MKVSGNYTAVCMHNQSRDVGRKPGCPKRKCTQHKKSDIEAYVDPFTSVLSSQGQSAASSLPDNLLRVLCAVYTKYPKVMTKHSVNGHLVSLILFMQFSTWQQKCTYCYYTPSNLNWN